jgi:hypothetical protein
MSQPHLVELAGRVAGAVVDNGSGLRFVALDPRLEEIDGSAWRSVAELRHAADHLLRTGSLPPRAPTAQRRSSHLSVVR